VLVIEVASNPLKALVETIAKALVDHPDGVQVNAVEGSQVTVLELRTDRDDLGKVIGRDGRIAAAIRTLLGAAGMKFRKRFTLEILEEEISENGRAYNRRTERNPQYPVDR
jgi:uncharacterized protein